MFVGQALRLGAVGAGCGLVAALAMTHLMSSLLFHVSAADSVTYAMVTSALIGATLVAATSLPGGRRGSRR